MATMDFSAVLQAMVNSTTPEAMMQRNMGVAMLAEKPRNVAAAGRESYRSTIESNTEAVAANRMTLAQAAKLEANAEIEMDCTSAFMVSYFKV